MHCGADEVLLLSYFIYGVRKKIFYLLEFSTVKDTLLGIPWNPPLTALSLATMTGPGYVWPQTELSLRWGFSLEV